MMIYIDVDMVIVADVGSVVGIVDMTIDVDMVIVVADMAIVDIDVAHMRPAEVDIAG